MKLYILRHGKAVEPSENIKDFNRSLSEKGINQADKIGQFLRDKKIGQIISSSAVRTKETCLIINNYIYCSNISYHDDLYLSSSQTILENICLNGKSDNLLFVGHNFGISDFVSDLSNENMTLSTCMLVELNIEIDNWKMLSSGLGAIQKTIKPNSL